MFGIGLPELIIILVVALIVFGPKKLPELAKALGRGMSEFKKASEEIKESLNINEDLRDVKRDLDESVQGVERSLEEVVYETQDGEAAAPEPVDRIPDPAQAANAGEDLSREAQTSSPSSEKGADEPK